MAFLGKERRNGGKKEGKKGKEGISSNVCPCKGPVFLLEHWIFFLIFFYQNIGYLIKLRTDSLVRK